MNYDWWSFWLWLEIDEKTHKKVLIIGNRNSDLDIGLKLDFLEIAGVAALKNSAWGNTIINSKIINKLIFSYRYLLFLDSY